MGADLVAFPEMAIPGYPPEDLLLKSQFIDDNRLYLDQVIAASHDIALVVGFADGKGDIYNAAAVAYNGQLVDIYHKIHLPNYGVFDEQRYFKPGNRCPVYLINGINIGVNVCEDIWYDNGPTNAQRAAGANIIININSSPYHRGKQMYREEILAKRATNNGLIVSYTNMVGGQDELVFDGTSTVFDRTGELLARGHQFQEELVIVDLDFDRMGMSDPDDNIPLNADIIRVSDYHTRRTRPSVPDREPLLLDPVAEVYAALVLGTKDYVHKSGFQVVVIGLSGGIDSSLTAAIAVEALGKKNVIGVSMPSRFSSTGSVTDAMLVAENLGITLLEIPIEPTVEAQLEMLECHFRDTQPGVAEENVQARIRGTSLMALSNKFGWLVLTTGNKSEMAVGYSTLYGDMAGGFAVIKDVPKTLVYELSNYLNVRAGKDIVPQSVIDKPPSAELRPDQRDDDLLPQYSVLDQILKAYVEDDCTYTSILDMGFHIQTVQNVIKMVDSSEYKRRQAPPGIKISPRNFGRDRRMPIINEYREF